MTSIGVLRPAAAREAYDHLGLYDWEEAYQEAAWGHGPEQDPQARAMLAATAGRTIRSAAECRPLDRLWHSAVQAGLIDVWATVARRGADPMTDPLERALVMLVGLTAHLHESTVEALIFLLMNAMVAPDGEIDTAFVEDAWWERSPLARSTPLERHGLLRGITDTQVRTAQVMLEDSGAWQRVGDQLTITDLGRCLTSVLTTMWDDGAFVEQ